MSCVSAISSRLTPEQLALANSQKFSYSSPPFRKSLKHRLKLMSESGNVKVRERAALDYMLPAKLAWKLASDPESSVRQCLARNRHVSIAALWKLSGDDDEKVRAHVALHPETPHYQIEIYADADSSKLVRSVAEWRLASERERG